MIASTVRLARPEATAHLDPPAAEALIRDVFTAAADASVLLITHRPEGLELADTILELRDGRVDEIALAHSRISDLTSPA
jgi:ABC-type transport system involved in cytochrome bd biosynthesis fused ATPase/permease subunit